MSNQNRRNLAAAVAVAGIALMSVTIAGAAPEGSDIITQMGAVIAGLPALVTTMVLVNRIHTEEE